MKNMGFNKTTYDEGDIGSYLKRAEQFPPLRITDYMWRMIVEEAVPVDDIEFFVVDEETGRRYSFRVREFLRGMEGLVKEPPPCQKNVRQRNLNFELGLSDLVRWSRSSKYSVTGPEGPRKNIKN